MGSERWLSMVIFVIVSATFAIQLPPYLYRQSGHDSPLKIRPKPCINTRGQKGQCMFVWDCIKGEGEHLGTCVDGFLFGSCCGHDSNKNVLSDKFKPSTATITTSIDVDKLDGERTTTPPFPEDSTDDQDFLAEVLREGALNVTGVLVSPSVSENVTNATVADHEKVPQKWTSLSAILHMVGDSHSESDGNETMAIENGTQYSQFGTNDVTDSHDNSNNENAIQEMFTPFIITTTTTTIKRLSSTAPTLTTANSKTPTVTTFRTTTATITTSPTATTTTTTPLPITMTTSPTTQLSTAATTTTTTTTTRPTTVSVADRTETRPEEVITDPVRVTSKVFQECGMPSMLPQMRIVGGNDSRFGAWPWQVSVRRSTFFGFSSTHRCGGAVLNENWVATAGHCVADLLLPQIRIRVGEYDLSSITEPYPFVERTVEKRVVNPKYNADTYEYDLALVKLDKPLQRSSNVAPICLPSGDELLVGDSATITGWGRLKEGGTLPSILQEVKVPIVSNSKCEQMFMDTGRRESIPDFFICAGYEQGGKDSCQGDSGGPLQIKGADGHWFLAGIISWGIGCGEPNLPGVCTRISKFRDWILNTIDKEGV